MKRKSRFLYRGGALALGGTITRPYAEALEAQAASILSMVGGVGSAHVKKFNYRDIISFGAAHSYVTGNESCRGENPTYNTLATVTIEDLNVSGLLTADRVVARLVSEKTPGEESELPMQPLGSSFTNLQVGGVPLDLRRQEILFRCRTLAELQREGGNELPSGAGGSLQLPAGWDEPSRAKDGAERFSDHHSMTSLFRLPRELPPGCSQGDTPWSLVIPGFGTVYFGEIHLSRHARRLSMLRLEMGSPVAGSVSLGYSEGNGSLYP